MLGIAVNLCNFLAYGTTSQVARRHGAGLEREAGEVAAQALWLALAIGISLGVVLAAAAQPLAEAHERRGRATRPTPPRATCGSRRSGCRRR